MSGNNDKRILAIMALVVVIVVIWGLTFIRRELRADVFVNAPVDHVWQILTNFPDYPRWNPYMREISGQLRPGDQLTVLLQPVGTRPEVIHPTVLGVQPKNEIHWVSRLVLPGVFDADYTLRLEAISPTKTRVFQHEVFSGIIVLPSLRWLEESVGTGMIQMNAALKFWAEGQPMQIQPTGTLLKPPHHFQIDPPNEPPGEKKNGTSPSPAPPSLPLWVSQRALGHRPDLSAFTRALSQPHPSLVRHASTYADANERNAALRMTHIIRDRDGDYIPLRQ